MQPKLLIFVPTFNERDNAPRMAKAIAELGLDADILFVDDNSPDGTGRLLDDLRAEIPRLLVHHRSGKLGIGSAHAGAIAWAYDQGYTTMVTLDCDFTHNPGDIPRLLSGLEAADAVVGSRWVTKNSLPGWNLMRRAITFSGHMLTRFVLGLEQDASGAFRAYHLGRVPQEAFALVKSSGYSFFFESLFLLKRNGCRIAEVAITLPARTYGSSKMTISAALKSAFYAFELRMREVRRPEDFLIAQAPASIDASLADPQNWDEYWSHAGQTNNPLYELIAGLYRRFVIKGNLERHIRRNFPGGARLLHAGCGSGQVDTDLQQEMCLNALDISPGALALYVRNNPQAESTQHGTVFRLPFEDGSFDGVYNLGVVEHFTEDEIVSIFRECRRVLKPDGKILLFWPHARATSVLVLGIVHRVLKNVLRSEKRLHPPEISLVRSRSHASRLLKEAGMALTSYSFGPADFFVQAVVVAQKEQ